ncbi:siderophore-interacting protein [Arthrobacter crystallopoietes BAB-32]|uniref:Siderophore-interacting protein n=1 Tax=Arthrobacter crystallopoietes BAB-32 TaxID=1246476 RepID=N1V260_9MICC|nr:siderophore-interacting protein [Arthrobacter crystallopoietes]EMY32308.1 siderophore-interacting protein [Arthrobacter crystallopoietes BAB-32]
MSAQPAAPAARARKPQINLQVTRTERLSEHMVRVYAGGPDFARFEAKDATDQYVKIWFIDPQLGVELPADVADLKESLPADKLPVSRTYTVRSVDAEAAELAIDFVVHGDEGLAGPWAAAAKPGDWLMFTGPGGKYSPAPDADWYLFAGDDAALPAVAAAIEALPADAAGHAFLEVDSAADTQELKAPAGVELHWLFRQGRPAGTTSLLRDAVAGLDWPQGDVDAFVHGERGAVKELRDVLFKQRGLSRQQVSISGYWAYGRAEDAFQAEKRTPVGQIFPDNYPA